MDQILGRQGSKAKDVYDSKICLAARIVKVERQVGVYISVLFLLLWMVQLCKFLDCCFILVVWAWFKGNLVK